MQDVIDRITRQWKRLGAPVYTELQPGLTDEDMDALTAPLGLRLPRELREWWGWQNGVADPSQVDSSIKGGWYVLSLQKAVAKTWSQRRFWAEETELAADLGLTWREDFLVVFDSNPGVQAVCDCAGRDLAPVHVFVAEEADRLTEPQLPCLTELLTWWVEELEADHHYAGETSLLPRLDVPDQPFDRLRTGLV